MTTSTAKPTAENTGSSRENLYLWIATGVLTLFYFLYSTKSKGFYQQDEANHYLSMLRFWYDPNAIMGNWAKPGYKILYVVTALGGQKLVILQNCLFAAFSCFFAWKTADKLGASNPWIAFLLLATQPLWIALSFRNYSEFPAAFMLVLGFYFFAQNRMWAAALLAGWICTIRQEFYPIAAVFGLYLLYRKFWVAAFITALMPVLQNLAGFYLYGDPLYLVNQILGTSDTLKDAYARQGFDHYFLTSAVVFGPIALTLFVLYLSQMFLKKEIQQPGILVATLVFFLLNCLFNWDAVHIGPATGGNLRYMCIISPLVAVCGALAMDQIRDMGSKVKLAYFIIPYLILVGIFLTYKHNFVKLTEESDNLPLVGALFGSVLVFLPLSRTVQTLVVAVLCGFMALLNVKAIKLSAEDKVCQQVADWYKQNEGTWKGKPFYNTHIMFYYFMGKVEKQFQPEPVAIADTATMEKAPVGSLILWDSHYGYRPNYKRGVPYEYFQQSGKYEPIQVFEAEDQRFAYVLMQKKRM
jgi:hypothetical protein